MLTSDDELSGIYGIENQPTRVAVVGLGYWGPNLLRVLSEQPDVKVTCICDLDHERLVQFRRRYPGVRSTTHFSRIVNDPDIDAVVIATPVHTHFALAEQALRAGKHTFVEKPLADSSDAADRLVELAAKNDCVLMCGHTFIYSPPVRIVKQLLSRGKLGDIFFISSSRVNLGLHQRDVSVVWDLAPHDFSILLYWLGELPISVRAVGRDSIVKGIADVAFVTMSFASGVIVNCEFSWLAPSKLRRTVVVGSEKMVIYDDGTAEPVRVFDRGVVYRDPETFGEYHLSYRSGDILSPKIDAYEPLSRELCDFVQASRTGDKLAFHTALARSVVRLVEATDSSLALGGQAVEIDWADIDEGLALDAEVMVA